MGGDDDDALTAHSQHEPWRLVILPWLISRRTALRVAMCVCGPLGCRRLACVLAAMVWLALVTAAVPMTAAILAVLVLAVAAFCYLLAVGIALVITAITAPLHFLLLLPS